VSARTALLNLVQTATSEVRDRFPITVGEFMPASPKMVGYRDDGL
jgi:hypothetical protein